MCVLVGSWCQASDMCLGKYLIHFPLKWAGMGEKWDYREMKGFVSNLIGSFPFHKSLSASQNRCWRSGHSLNCRRAEHMLRTNSQKQNQTNVNTHTHTRTGFQVRPIMAYIRALSFRDQIIQRETCRVKNFFLIKTSLIKPSKYE